MSDEIARIPVIEMRDGVARTSTLEVAFFTERDHKNVLRTYDALDCSAEFSRLNFEPRDYGDDRGKTYRAVDMTRDGFMFLISRMTGEKPAMVMEAFIAAFNAMERKLAARAVQLSADETFYKGLLDRLVTGQNVLAEVSSKNTTAISDLESEQKLIKCDIIYLKDAVNDRRKHFSASVKKQIAYATYQQGGICPCCRDRSKIVVNDDLKAVDGSEFDHFEGRHKARSQDGWLVCRECHDDMDRTGVTNKSRKRENFHNFQANFAEMPADQGRFTF